MIEAVRQTKAATCCLLALFDRTNQQIARAPACCSIKEWKALACFRLWFPFARRLYFKGTRKPSDGVCSIHISNANQAPFISNPLSVNINWTRPSQSNRHEKSHEIMREIWRILNFQNDNDYYILRPSEGLLRRGFLERASEKPGKVLAQAVNFRREWSVVN